MMEPIYFDFEFSNDADPNTAAALLQKRLSDLEDVERVKAEPSVGRIGIGEVVVVISAIVGLVSTSRQLVEETREFIKAVKELRAEIAGLNNVSVEVGTERIPIDDLTDEHIKTLAGGSNA
jgi:hypothetical protein